MKLIFATNNQHKVTEIKGALTKGLEMITLSEADIDIDIPEPHETIEENATEKSKVIYAITQQNCLSEDTGLQVTALSGAPGVRSARYAGDECDNEKNIILLLKNMEDVEDRSAQFKTVISLIIDGEEQLFTGICKGQIIHNKIGENGFGYDAIFKPEGSEKTFAQMTMDEKNLFSHRKKALVKLIDYLNKM